LRIELEKMRTSYNIEKKEERIYINMAMAFPGWFSGRASFSLKQVVLENIIKYMETKVLRVTHPREFHLLDEAVSVLQGGQIVAIPTETVYGLAANALDPAACEKIYSAKNRPHDNPLILHISNYTMLKPIADVEKIPPEAYALMDEFWPGPLTLILPKAKDYTGTSLPTVAVRMPNHRVALELIHRCNFPLAAPSANLSGKPSPTCAEHVINDLNGRIPLVIDAVSRSKFGVESTVLDIQNRLILRPGYVTKELLEPYLPGVEYYESTEHWSKIDVNRPPTPGMKYRHYSPDSPLFLYYSPEPGKIDADIAKYILEGKVIVRILNNICSNDLADQYEKLFFSKIGDNDEIAYNLFDVLRRADSLKPDIIIAEAVTTGPFVEAIMNRLEKAASQKISHENPTAQIN
jgi:L-threonylcarbamoyladenylate synthase